MQARLYLRVSTDEQAATGFSLAAQQERLHAFCVSQGWSTAGIYTDDGASGKDTNRPEFQRMLKDSQPGDVVLVYKLDRMTRSVRDLDDLLRLFEKQSLYFRSATENFDTTTATGRMMIRMVGEFAQWERETIVERATMGKRKRVASGEWAGGPAPFGYMSVPSERIKAGRALMDIVPDPKTRHIIPMLFERYLSGHGLFDVCRWLNDELGVRTTAGGRFTVATVRGMLLNPVYCGDVKYGKLYGTIAKKDQFVTPGRHEPLISRADFERVQQIFDGRKGLPPRYGAGKHLLTGIARCGVCGGPIYGRIRTDNHRPLYRCRNLSQGLICGGDSQRSLTSATEPVTDALFLEELQKKLTQPIELDRFIADFVRESERQTGSGEAEVERLKADLEETETAISQWKRLFAKKGISDEEYLAEVGPLREREKALQGKLEESEAARHRLPASDAIATAAVDLVANWQWMEPEERKLVVRGFVRRFGLSVLIFPGPRVEIQFVR